LTLFCALELESTREQGLYPILLLAVVLPFSQAFSPLFTGKSGPSCPAISRDGSNRVGIRAVNLMMPRGNRAKSALQATDGEEFEITDAIREAEEKSVPFRVDSHITELSSSTRHLYCFPPLIHGTYSTALSISNVQGGANSDLSGFASIFHSAWRCHRSRPVRWDGTKKLLSYCPLVCGDNFSWSSVAWRINNGVCFCVSSKPRQRVVISF